MSAVAHHRCLSLHRGVTLFLVRKRAEASRATCRTVTLGPYNVDYNELKSMRDIERDNCLIRFDQECQLVAAVGIMTLPNFGDAPPRQRFSCQGEEIGFTSRPPCKVSWTVF